MITPPSLTLDSGILWLARTLQGTPSTWTSGTNYNLGDTVIPTPTFYINNPSFPTNIMFQVVGFVGKSGASQPAFPLTIGQTVDDNTVIWEAIDPTKNPPNLPFDQYYLISPTITVT